MLRFSLLVITKAMIALPPPLQAIIAELPIPNDLRVLPPHHLLLQFIVNMTTEYRALVPELDDPKLWAPMKARFAERCQALKISDYISLYEHPEKVIPFALKASSLEDFSEIISTTAIEHGYEDLLSQSIDSADPERVRALIQIVIETIMTWIVEVDQAIDDNDSASTEDYWENIHSTLSIEEQRKAETDAQIFMCVFLFALHNAISTMAYGESLSSLVQRALSNDPEADIAMCKAVRVDNALRQHPKFMERYLHATNKSESSFLNRYNITSSPLSGKIRFPGLYFLFSLLDGFGILGQLTNPQILDLCDHAKLDRWENRIEDAGYLAKRRLAFIDHKFF